MLARSRKAAIWAFMSLQGHLRHFERPLGMSVMPPIATENGEALNARGETARYTSEGIVLCRQRAVALFERLPKRFLCLGFFFAKWSKLLRLPFPTSAACLLSRPG
jgi:hypothetical protein